MWDRNNWVTDYAFDKIVFFLRHITRNQLPAEIDQLPKTKKRVLDYFLHGPSIVAKCLLEHIYSLQ